MLQQHYSKQDLREILQKTKLAYTQSNQVFKNEFDEYVEIKQIMDDKFECKKSALNGNTHCILVDKYGCVECVKTEWQFVAMKSMDDKGVFLYPTQCTENTIIISVVRKNKWYTKLFAVNPFFFNLLNQDNAHTETPMEHFVRVKSPEWMKEVKEVLKKG
jgi:hypothetical protein